MRISTLFSTFASLSYLLVDAANTGGTVLRINGIQSNPKLNDCYAVILDDSNGKVRSGRSGVMALLNEKFLSFDPNSSDAFSPVDYFPTISVSNTNLHHFPWNYIPKNEQYFTFEQYSELDRVVDFLWKLCDKKPEVFLDYGINESRARLVGAWILQKYHFAAMQYVADKNRRLTGYL